MIELAEGLHDLCLASCDALPSLSKNMGLWFGTSLCRIHVCGLSPRFAA